MFCASMNCSRTVSTGSGICAHCRRAVHRELRSLPDLYDDSGGRLVGTPQGVVERVRSTRAAGISLNEAALRIRSDILDVLSSWCTLVVQERGVAGPRRRTAEDLAVFLDRQLPWLAGHPAVGDFTAEVRELATAARQVVDHGASQPRPLGPCDRPGCSSIVYLTRLGDDRRGRVRCASGHVWQPHEWLLLSRRMQRGAASPQAGCAA
jgi:hypothetical protein